jgi:probable HAF family extracellular repeat protein
VCPDPFYWDGALHDLGTVGGDNGDAYEVTDDGLIVGNTENASLAMRATLWTTEGAIIDLGTLGGAESHARDINANGLVVGFSYLADGNWHAALWATEGDGGPSTVPEVLDELRAGIEDILSNGLFRTWRARGLLIRVRIAERLYERGYPIAAAFVMRSLIRRLELYVEFGWVSAEEAQPLSDLAQQAIDLLLE